MSKIINQHGVEIEFNDIIGFLDSGLSEYIAMSFAKERLTDQEFFNCYCVMHRIHTEEYGLRGEFEPNTWKAEE